MGCQLAPSYMANSPPGFTANCPPAGGQFAVNPGGLFAMYEGASWHPIASLLGSSTALVASPVSGNYAVWNGGSDLTDSGLPSKPGAVSLTAQTALIANGTSLCAASTSHCNTPGHYRVTAYLYSTVVCPTPSTAAIGLNVTWTDK